ncbi:electron transporter [Deinococcus roseus]|uniref:Electron transporter n=1 Tax=Deinococcus roseus TaxID=392414 RepID=A0ABQ2CXZ7_9DEIO|nr:electron transporter [Deinococcus roseus]
MKKTNPTLITLILGLLVLAGIWAYKKFTPAELHGTVVEAKPLIPELPLIDTAGKPHTLNQDAGIKLVFFGFTRCPDICPATMSILRRAYEGAGSPRNVKVYLISVDPETDTPAVLKRYVESFQKDFVGLTGNADNIARLANAFYVGFNENPDGLITHTDIVAVLDQQNRMRLIYNQEKLGKGLLDQDLPALAKGQL